MGQGATSARDQRVPPFHIVEMGPVRRVNNIIGNNDFVNDIIVNNDLFL